MVKSFRAHNEVFSKDFKCPLFSTSGARCRNIFQACEVLLDYLFVLQLGVVQVGFEMLYFHNFLVNQNYMFPGMLFPSFAGYLLMTIKTDIVVKMTEVLG